MSLFNDDLYWLLLQKVSKIPEFKGETHEALSEFLSKLDQIYDTIVKNNSEIAETFVTLIKGQLHYSVFQKLKHAEINLDTYPSLKTWLTSLIETKPKLPRYFQQFYESYESLSALPNNDIESNITYFKKTLNSFVNLASKEPHCYETHCRSTIEVCVTELCFFEELSISKALYYDLNLDHTRIQNRISNKLHVIQHQIFNSIENKSPQTSETTYQSEHELSSMTESDIKSQSDDISANDFDSGFEIENEFLDHVSTSGQLDPNCLIVPTGLKDPPSKITIHSILSTQPATTVLAKPVRPVSGERYGRDTVRPSFGPPSHYLCKPTSSLPPTRPPAEPPPNVPVHCA